MFKAKMRKLSIAMLAFVMVATLSVGITVFSPNKVASAATTSYSTKTQSADGLTITWDYSAVTAQYKIGSYKTSGNDDNGLIFDASSESNAKTVSGSGISIKGGSSVYIPVPNGYNGNLSMTTYGSSNNRYFSLVVNGVETGKRLYSKLNATEQVGVSGPQAFDFTVDELTVYNGQKYVVIKDNNAEMKVKSFTLKLVAEKITVTYDAGEGTDAPQTEELAITATETVVAGAPTDPDGKVFAGWSDGTAVYQPNAFYPIANGTTSVSFTAVYNTVIDQIVDPTAIVKVFGADLTVDTLGLPATITGLTVDGEVEIPVVWDTTTLDLTGVNQEVQTVNGTFTAPNGYVFDGVVVDGTVTIDVTVLATAPEITDFELLNDVDVRALSASVNLPTEVGATVNGQIVTLPITGWEGTYDLTTVGVYTLTAIVDAGQYILPAELKATLIVNVYADEVVSVEEVLVRVTPNATLSLPETVKVTLQDTLTLESYEKQVAVVWNMDAVDLTTVGTYQAVGTVAFDASMDTHGQTLNAIAIVNVVNETVVSWTAHDDMTAGDKLGVNWTTVYTDKVLASKNNIVIKAESGCSADNHPYTLPMIKVAKGQNKAISITIPQGASDVVISVDGAGYSNGKSGNVVIYDAQGTNLASASITNSSTGSGTSSADYVAPTVVTATLNNVGAGVYYIGATSENNIYITAINVTAVVPELVTVTYNANGGESAPNAVDYEKGMTATIANGAVPQKGYEFVEWNTAIDGTGTSYKVGDQLTVEQNVELFAIYKKVVTSVEFNAMPDVIMVKADFDTAILTSTVNEVLGLPATVKGYLVDGTQLDLAIDWTASLEAFQTASSAVGSYDFEGVIVSNDYNFDSAVIQTVSLKVTILAEKISITAIEPISVEVELGQTAVLPTTVTAVLSDQTKATLTVDFTSANVDFTKVGTNAYEGVVEYNANAMELGVDVKAVYNVTVYNYTIVGFESLSAVNAFTGDAVPTLPAKVIASYVDRSGVTQQTELEISSWDTTAVTMTTAGSYQAVGTVAFTDLYLQGDASATVTVDVVVSDYVQASTARSTNFKDYNLNASGTLRGFTMTGTLEAGAIAGLQGQKIKNGSISFTLTAPATVTMSIGLQKDLGLKFSDGTTSEPIGTVGSAVVVTKQLGAGTYSIGSTSTAGSFSIGYIIIDDGASELFVATAENNVLPACVNNKTVDGVTYTFYGYVTKTSTEIIPAGSTVEAGDYYALYVAGASLKNGAGIQVVSADKQIRFTSNVQMLNAKALFQAVRTNGILSFNYDVTLNGSSAVSTESVAFPSDDKALVYKVLAVEKFTNVYTASLNASIGSVVLADNQSVNASAKQIAEALTADIKPASEGVYKFQTADGYARFNTAEREMIATYIVDDADPVDPVDPNPVDPVDPVDPNPVDPVDPVDPNPVDPVDPVDPNPVDPVDPVDPNPVDPVDPVDPNLVDPVDPVDPNPVDPVDPVNPVNPDPTVTDPVETEPTV